MYKKSFIIGLLFITVLMTACTQGETKSLVIASKPMTEQFILSEMLTAVIEAKTDIEVEQKQGIGGGTSNIHPGMISGEIDIYPEYTGTGWLFVLKEDAVNDPEEIYKGVKEKYASEYNIHWTGKYGFNDTFGIAMKKDVAEEMGIRTYSDLAKKSSELTFGAEYDFYEREDGMPGLEEVYGFDFKKTAELDIGLKYQAIGSDEVDVINVFSTDGRLKQEELVVLEDDKRFFPDYQAATLVRQETLDKYPELEEVLEVLTGKISGEEMIYMNYLVEVEKKDPAQVAKDFLMDEGILTE